MQRDEATVHSQRASPRSLDEQIRSVLSGFYGIGRKRLFSKDLATL
jgi:hypothetical protein